MRRGFSIFDADDQLAIVKDLAPSGSKNDALHALQNLISAAKNNGLSPEQAAEAARSVREREAAGIYAGMRDARSQRVAVLPSVRA